MGHTVDFVCGSIDVDGLLERLGLQRKPDGEEAAKPERLSDGKN
jgi:hypothetical protein